MTLTDLLEKTGSEDRVDKIPLRIKRWRKMLSKLDITSGLLNIVVPSCVVRIHLGGLENDLERQRCEC
jgi:hypothetical protein